MSVDTQPRMYGEEFESNPRQLLEQWRAEYGAVAPVLVHDDQPVWLVLGYAENHEATRATARFTRDSRVWPPLQNGEVGPDSPLAPIIFPQPLVSFRDGPEHERLRAAVVESLDKVDSRGARRRATRFADQLIDEFCTKGEADLVSQFAVFLPMLVMTQLFGMLDEDGRSLAETVLDLMRASETAEKSNAMVTSMLQELVAKKKASPGEDLPSWLLAHERQLTDDEVVQHLRLILVVGGGPTVNLIANALAVLLTDPRFRAHLSGGNLTPDEALEQILWDEPPVPWYPGRWAVGDTELGGQKIKAGDMMMICPAAANVDPRIRPDLEEPVHGNRAHQAFSAGPHECPGQDIARAIAAAGIDRLLVRLPDLHREDEEAPLSWASAGISRMLTDLQVVFTPKQPTGKPRPVTPPVAEEPVAAPTPDPEPAPQTSAPAPTRRSWWRRLFGL
jgi:cytochrome P450